MSAAAAAAAAAAGSDMHQYLWQIYLLNTWKFIYM